MLVFETVIHTKLNFTLSLYPEKESVHGFKKKKGISKWDQPFNLEFIDFSCKQRFDQILRRNDMLLYIIKGTADPGFVLFFFAFLIYFYFVLFFKPSSIL